MAIQRDWKQEFLDLADQQDEEQRVHKEQLGQLARAIVRLCIASSGFDPLLDKHLGRIRQFAKKERFREMLEQIGELGDDLLRQDTRNDDASEGAAGLLERLLGYIESRRPGRDTRLLLERFRHSPETIRDQDIDQLLQRLVPEAAGDNAATAVDTGEQPTKLLAELLRRLEWPEQIRQDIASLRERLLQSPDPGGWVSALEDVATLLADVLGQTRLRIKATEDFLVQVTSQLEELDRYVSGSRDARQASLKSGQRLGHMVDEEVRQMHRRVAAGDDLDQLRKQIGDSVDTIRQHVQSHILGERKRHAKTEQLENNLQQRTEQLEQELQQVRKQLREAHRRATLDALTGIPNRMAYDERLAEEYKRWKRYNNFLVLMVWDIDDFKQVNDRFGHQAGDKTLRIIAQILKSRIRETDFIARYGGEEIVTLLIGSPVEEALKVAEEMRTAVEASAFHTGGKRVGITVSCGISEYRSGDTPASVFKRADEALYRAKAEGKNRCIVG